MPQYNPKDVEPRWQQFWDQRKTFKTPDTSDKPKYYILDMFPYPSGAGLHVGHPEGYTATDILARYKRMRGFNVLHPMGWDAFGLPAEQYAIETGTHPRDTTKKNIENFRRQIKMLGFSYDWDREVDTTDPNYFKWTQWIFLQLFDTWYDKERNKGRPISELPIPDDVQKQGDAAIRAYRDSKRLAYQDEIPVNWCPKLGTVLANEEVVDGKSERGGHSVVRMPLRQWLLRITEYAERLLADLDIVDWPEPIKKMQRDWIGRSEGAEVDFRVASRRRKPSENDAPRDADDSPTANAAGSPVIRVFTTRPDTLFGATYMVLAPEHPLVDKITIPEQKDAVKKYQQKAAGKSDLERTDLAKEKSGVFTGAYAINPVNNEAIPIWIADYVLISYGTGAIMAVPAHDLRDWEFAKQWKLPIRQVVEPPADYQPTAEEKALACKEDGKTMYPFAGHGTAINSGEFTGLPTPKFKTKITAWLTERGLGEGKINYKLRDWLFSRQRYWGEPFPILHNAEDPSDVVPLSPDELPLRLPEMEDYKPSSTVQSPIDKFREYLASRPKPQKLTEQQSQVIGVIMAEQGPFDADDLIDKIKGDGIEVSRATIFRTLKKLTDAGILREIEVGRIYEYAFDPKRSVQPEPPLGKAKDWVHVERDGKRYLRETNTMPQWAGSCWYYLRYIDPDNKEAFCDPQKEKYWMPVDLYVGGAEHAVLHLLYARFWHKVLYDRGHVSTAEPFQRLVNQGIILGELEFTGFQKKDEWLSAEKVDFRNGKDKKTGQQYERVKLDKDNVEKQGDGFVLKADPKIRVDARAYKMSKARGNVVNPDEVVDKFGADSLRLYEMFMGPLEAMKPWSMDSVEGVFRFLNRVWRLVLNDLDEETKVAAYLQDVEPDKDTLRKLHITVKKVTEDLDSMSFNTAIAAMMELTNHLTKANVKPRKVVETLVVLLSPFAPHLCEELWQILGNTDTLAYEPWPSYDEALTKADEIEVPIQVNGKVRSKITVSAGIEEDALEKTALADDKLQSFLEGKTVRKVIVVKRKLVNVVAN